MKCALLLSVVVSLFITPALADEPELDPKASINLYMTKPSYVGSQLLQNSDFPICESLRDLPEGSDDGIFVWVFFCREGGLPYNGCEAIGGVQFGIEYSPTVIVKEWTLATGGLDIGEGDQWGLPDWPESGSSYAATWLGGAYVPPGDCAKVGYFMIDFGSTGEMQITRHPVDEQALWACGCLGEEIQCYKICKARLGRLDLETGVELVCGNQCPTPIVERSWGRIKAQYR